MSWLKISFFLAVALSTVVPREYVKPTQFMSNSTQFIPEELEDGQLLLDSDSVKVKLSVVLRKCYYFPSYEGLYNPAICEITVTTDNDIATALLYSPDPATHPFYEIASLATINDNGYREYKFAGGIYNDRVMVIKLPQEPTEKEMDGHIGLAQDFNDATGMRTGLFKVMKYRHLGRLIRDEDLEDRIRSLENDLCRMFIKHVYMQDPDSLLIMRAILTEENEIVLGLAPRHPAILSRVIHQQRDWNLDFYEYRRPNDPRYRNWDFEIIARGLPGSFEIYQLSQVSSDFIDQSSLFEDPLRQWNSADNKKHIVINTENPITRILLVDQPGQTAHRVGVKSTLSRIHDILPLAEELGRTFPEVALRRIVSPFDLYNLG